MFTFLIKLLLCDKKCKSAITQRKIDLICTNVSSGTNVNKLKLNIFKF